MLLQEEKVNEGLRLALEILKKSLANAKGREIFKHKSAIDVLSELYEDMRPREKSCFVRHYKCGTEPTWKVGDVLAVPLSLGEEDEEVYGKVVEIKRDSDGDWLYVFDDGGELCEYGLISEQAYIKKQSNDKLHR